MLRPIGESLGTDQLGLSTTLNKVTLTCTQCGKQWDSFTRDGKALSTTCTHCAGQKRLEDARRKAEAELPKAIQEIRCSWWEQSGVPSRFGLKTFENFDQSLQPNAFQAIKKYAVEKLYEYNMDEEAPGKSLLILSPDTYGLGKTHLVCALIDYMIEHTQAAWIDQYNNIRHKPFPALFTTEVAILDRIRSTFDHKDEGESESKIYKQLINIPLLIIDDVGKVRPKDYSFLQGVYFKIIDGRYSEGSPVVLTTNLSYDELEQHIGGASADRLREMCGKKGFITMTGKSYRKGLK